MKKLLVLALVLALLCGCMTAVAEEPKAGGRLVIGEYILDTQLANLNPYITSGTANNTIRQLMYDALTYYNPVDGVIYPILATEWAFNADCTAIVFKIREGVTFHDGEAFDASDVAFSYNMIKGNALDTFGLWAKLTSVEATGDFEVTMTFNAPFPSFVSYTSDIYIVPEHIWSTVDDVAAYLNPNPVGTGAFIFRKYTVGTDLQFDANKNYWEKAPYVDELIMELYNSSPNVTLALLAGEIECTFGTITMSNIPELLTREHMILQLYAGLTNWVVSFNMENELAQDVAVRKAMCMAIDQNALITRCEYNGVFPINMAWLPNLFGDMVNAPANEILKNDPAAARAVLEEAGYVKGKDGVYAKDGKRLSFTYYNASGAPAQQMEAGMIQQYLLNIGVEIIPRIATWAELAVIRQQGNYDLLQNSYAFPADPYAALFNCFHSSQTAPSGEPTPGLNNFRYRNPEFDAIVDQLATETDVAKQKELIWKAQDILANEYIYLPMYNSGGHNPYYDGKTVAGWKASFPISRAQCLIHVYDLAVQ